MSQSQCRKRVVTFVLSPNCFPIYRAFDELGEMIDVLPRTTFFLLKNMPPLCLPQCISIHSNCLSFLPPSDKSICAFSWMLWICILQRFSPTSGVRSKNCVSTHAISITKHLGIFIHLELPDPVNLQLLHVFCCRFNCSCISNIQCCTRWNSNSKFCFKRRSLVSNKPALNIKTDGYSIWIPTNSF